MLHKEVEEIKTKIKEAITEINTYPDKDCFINAHFTQFLNWGEYDDNSIELSYEYTLLKEIEVEIKKNDEFFEKITFILNKFVRSPKIAKMLRK